MTIMIMRVIAILVLICSMGYSQMGGMGSMRDPRTASSQSSVSGSIEPWLAVMGNYDTYLDAPPGVTGGGRESLTLHGGLSIAKSYHRTVFVLGYAGAGNYYAGDTSSYRKGWTSSNVVDLAVSSQVTRRLTLDFAELGGAGTGGFGAGSAGMQMGGLGMLGSIGVSSGFLYGGIPGLSGGTGLNPLNNGVVDADYYDQMTYFSGTQGGAGYLLTQRTMVNVSGNAFITRREGRSFSDSNMYGSTVALSTQFNSRVIGFAGYAYNQINFVQSTGTTNVHAGFAGASFILGPRDTFNLSANEAYVDSHFIATVALPPDVAALLGVSTTTVESNRNRRVIGGRFGYNHGFQRGGLDLSCSSTLAPGNDLIQLSRTEGCTATFGTRLVRRVGASVLGGFRRLDGLSQSGGRYDVFTGGAYLTYRVMGGLSLTAGASYRNARFSGSDTSNTGVSAHAGLRWSPRDGLHIF